MRDLLLGRPPTDLDVTTAASPEAVAALFDHTVPVGAEFGVVAVIVRGHPYQVATFRQEGPYLDGRHPSYTGPADARGDARRRDFTINALLYDTESGEVVDHVGGRADLERRLIRTVGPPAQRFAEDRLRLLRAVRLAAELGFAIEPETRSALAALSGTITAVSAERVRDELLRILAAPGRSEGVEILCETGLLATVLPEVAALGRGARSAAAGDLLAHTCTVLAQLRRPTPELAMAALLHHLDSPDSATLVCRRLRMSRAAARTVGALVGCLSVVPALPGMRPSQRRALLLRAPAADLLELHRADVAAQGGDPGAYRRAAAVVASHRGALRGPPGLLSGHDLIALGYQPGPGFARILEALEQARLRCEIGSPGEARRWVAARFPRGTGSARAEAAGGRDPIGRGG